MKLKKLYIFIIILSYNLESSLLAMGKSIFLPAINNHISFSNITIPYNPIFKVMSYNIDNAFREEEYDKTKWNNRSPKVIKIINEANPDIVCLQELRDLPGTSVNRFLSKFNQYHFVIARRNPSTFAFGQATLYKREKAFPLISFPEWFTPTLEEASDAGNNMVLCTKFSLVHNEEILKNISPFWVFNTQFGIDEQIKTKSCYRLLEIIEKNAKKDPYIVCGDFNFFPDKDGDAQRAILTKNMQDLGKNAQTLAGKKVEGTFIGYEHNQFKANLENMVSRLDHIFGSKTVQKVGPAILYTKTMLDKEPEELTTRDYPSDHLPLIVKLKLFGGPKKKEFAQTSLGLKACAKKQMHKKNNQENTNNSFKTALIALNILSPQCPLNTNRYHFNSSRCPLDTGRYYLNSSIPLNKIKK